MKAQAAAFSLFFYLIQFDSDIFLKESNTLTFPCGTQCHVSSLKSVSMTDQIKLLCGP